MRYSGGLILERCFTVKFYIIDTILSKNKIFHNHVSLSVSETADGVWPC